MSRAPSGRTVNTGVGYQVAVRLDDIDVDDAWNARSGNWQEDPALDDTADGGYAGLRDSIRTTGGNKVPVRLRPTPKGRKPFQLVEGFRRMRALREIGLEHAFAVVEECTDAEARAANLRENVRSDLKPADLAWGVADLKREAPHLTEEQIGKSIGIPQSTVNNLLFIMRGLKPEICQEWRNSPVRVPTSGLRAVAALPHDEQPAQWRELLTGLGSSLAGPSKRSDVFMKHKARAYDLGRKLAILEQMGAIRLELKLDRADDGSLDRSRHGGLWIGVVMAALSVPRTMRAEKLTRIVAGMQDGYKAGVEAATKNKGEVEE